MPLIPLEKLLVGMIQKDATDLYLAVGAVPIMSIHGVFMGVGQTKLTNEDTREYGMEMMTPHQRAEFEREFEVNLSYSLDTRGRFRVSVYTQRGLMSLVIRQIKISTPTFEQLNLPERLGEMIMAQNGLLLVTGSAGSGKSTTFAAMINYRNERVGGHIITLEDPIEFIHENKMSIITQRAIGEDTKSYDIALKNTLRQAPQVIYIGEIRDSATMEFALHAAETGHLVLGTLHSTNANQTLERILNFFPHNFHMQLLYQLALSLRGIVSQRLIPSIKGGRVPALEFLSRTPYVASLIAKGDITTLKDAMAAGEQDGLQTFDMDLLRLFTDGHITEEEALKNADSGNNLRLRMMGVTTGKK